MQPVSYLVLIDGSYYTCIEKKVHWLPIQYQIQSKISVFMHQCFRRRCPQYIFDLVSFRTGTGRLCSATTRAAVTHRPRTNLGRRAFSIAGPSVRNSLPQSLRLIDDHEQFRKQLKTYYFNIAANSHTPSQCMSQLCCACRLRTFSYCNAPLSIGFIVNGSFT